MQSGTPGKGLKGSCRHQPQVQMVGRMIAPAAHMMLLAGQTSNVYAFKLPLTGIEEARGGN